jgi:hypothetical protein
MLNRRPWQHRLRATRTLPSASNSGSGSIGDLGLKSGFEVFEVVEPEGAFAVVR